MDLYDALAKKRKANEAMRFCDLEFSAKTRETEKAYCFDGHWIPKSLIKFGSFGNKKRNTIEVSVPKWFVEKEGLDDFVIDSWVEGQDDTDYYLINPQ